ncbi:MAG: type II toxin-antitoxin system VapC family toxin [Pirellulales bacterium]
MISVFADTSFYIALVNPGDEAHTAARTHAAGYRGQVVTTDFVLVELGNMLSRVGDREVFVQLWNQLQSDPRTSIVPADRGLLSRAQDLFASRLDKEWSLTDCASFVVMQEAVIREAFTTDHHFEQVGFIALLK